MGKELMSKNGESKIDPQQVVITEPVKDSPIPVDLMLIEMIDGVYAPIGLRKPPGKGPFPLILFASGNGGGGMAWVRDATQNKSWTQEQFLAAGAAAIELDRREHAFFVEAAVQVDFAVAGALELFEDHFVHPAAGVDQSRRDDGQ